MHFICRSGTVNFEVIRWPGFALSGNLNYKMISNSNFAKQIEQELSLNKNFGLGIYLN